MIVLCLIQFLIGLSLVSPLFRKFLTVLILTCLTHRVDCCRLSPVMGIFTRWRPSIFDVLSPYQ